MLPHKSDQSAANADNIAMVKALVGAIVSTAEENLSVDEYVSAFFNEPINVN